MMAAGVCRHGSKFYDLIESDPGDGDLLAVVTLRMAKTFRVTSAYSNFSQKYQRFKKRRYQGSNLG